MKYDPNNFIKVLTEKIQGKEYPSCPICGGDQFAAAEKCATLPISAEVGNMFLGPNITAGAIICQSCGHMEFFALGVLNLLNKEGDKDGK